MIKNYKETVKKINQAFSKQSVLILGLLAFNFIAIADIFVDVASPPRIYSFETSYSEEIYPIEPNETGTIIDNAVFAAGQEGYINVSTSKNSSLKVVAINFGSQVEYSNFSPYFSINQTQHVLNIPPVKEYTVFRVFLMNPNTENLDFKGFIAITGLNHHKLLLCFLITIILICITLIPLVNQSINLDWGRFFSRKDESDEKIPHSTSFIPQFFILDKFQNHEFSLLRTTFIASLIWLIVQPLAPVIDFDLGSGTKNVHLLRVAETTLLNPMSFGLFILAIFIALDTAEVIAAKRTRRALLFIFSLPFRRIDWLIVSFIWELKLYGGFFLIAFLLKIISISFQIRFILPLDLILFLIILILISICTWISTGIMISCFSSSRISATVGTLTIIVIGSVWVNISTKTEYNNGGGILGLFDFVFSRWLNYHEYNRDITIVGNLVVTSPQLGLLLDSIFLTIVWFSLVSILGMVKISKTDVS